MCKTICKRKEAWPIYRRPDGGMLPNPDKSRTGLLIYKQEDMPAQVTLVYREWMALQEYVRCAENTKKDLARVNEVVFRRDTSITAQQNMLKILNGTVQRLETEAKAAAEGARAEAGTAADHKSKLGRAFKLGFSAVGSADASDIGDMSDAGVGAILHTLDVAHAKELQEQTAQHARDVAQLKQEHTLQMAQLRQEHTLRMAAFDPPVDPSIDAVETGDVEVNVRDVYDSAVHKRMKRKADDM